MTDAHVEKTTGDSLDQPGNMDAGTSDKGQTPGSHSELFGLEGRKRPSTTAGAGAGSGVIGAPGHVGSANKGANIDVGGGAQNAKVGGMEEGGKSSGISGSGGESFTPKQGSGDVRPAGEATGEKSLLDKLNPMK